MIKNKALILLFVCILTIISCNKTPYKNLNLDKAIKLLNTSTNFTIIDVRTREEFIVKNIPNSINIDVLSVDFKSKILSLDTNREYLLYCSTGNRSSIASSIMATNGFSKLYNFSGNFDDISSYIITNQ